VVNGAERKVCAATRPSVVVMSYDMNGTGAGNLGTAKIKSSGVSNDKRCFKITYVLANNTRLYTFRELQNVYTTKMVPFSSWYSEQQRIMKMGGKITSVELVVGQPNRNVGCI